MIACAIVHYWMVFLQALQHTTLVALALWFTLNVTVLLSAQLVGNSAAVVCVPIVSVGSEIHWLEWSSMSLSPTPQSGLLLGLCSTIAQQGVTLWRMEEVWWLPEGWTCHQPLVGKSCNKKIEHLMPVRKSWSSNLQIEMELVQQMAPLSVPNLEKE